MVTIKDDQDEKIKKKTVFLSLWGGTACHYMHVEIGGGSLLFCESWGFNPVDRLGSRHFYLLSHLTSS